jgi:hypothetical protein
MTARLSRPAGSERRRGLESVKKTDQVASLMGTGAIQIGCRLIGP